MRISPAVQIDEQPVRDGDKRHEREHRTCVSVGVCNVQVVLMESDFLSVISRRFIVFDS